MSRIHLNYTLQEGWGGGWTLHTSDCNNKSTLKIQYILQMSQSGLEIFLIFLSGEVLAERWSDKTTQGLPALPPSH